MELVGGIIGDYVVGAGALYAAEIATLHMRSFVSAEELLKTVQPGDLIEFKRDGYSHYGMYSDEPGYVFNVPAEGKDANRVTITLEKLVDVAGRSPVRVNNHEKAAARLGYTRRSSTDAVKAARSALGQPLPYEFLGRNCECYCTEWLYGPGSDFTTQVAKGIHKGLEIQVAAFINAIGGPWVTIPAAFVYIYFIKERDVFSLDRVSLSASSAVGPGIKVARSAIQQQLFRLFSIPF